MFHRITNLDLLNKILELEKSILELNKKNGDKTI